MSGNQIMQKLQKWQAQAVGGDVTQLYWRLTGIVLFLSYGPFIFEWGFEGWDAFTGGAEKWGSGLFIKFFNSIFLVALGAHPIAIGVDLIGSVVMSAEIIFDPTKFPAAQMLVVIFPPLIAALGWVFLRFNKTETSVAKKNLDALHIYGTGAVVLVCFFSTGFHKLNSDFFDLTVSCLQTVRSFVGANWGETIFGMTSFASPALIVFSEMAMPFLVLLFPRLGILLAGPMLTFFGSLGATHITTWVFIGCYLWSGISWNQIWELRKNKALIGICAGIGFLSLALKEGTSWNRFFTGVFIFVMFYLTLAPAFLGTIEELFRQRKMTDFKAGLREMGPLKYLALVFVVVTVINNLIPYTGIKHKFSFSMWSNLRADDNRWNSYVMPRFLDISNEEKHFGSFDVVKASPLQFTKKPDSEWNQKNVIEPLLFAEKAFAPYFFRYEIEGKEKVLEGQGGDKKLMQFLKVLQYKDAFDQMKPKELKIQPSLSNVVKLDAGNLYHLGSLRQRLAKMKILFGRYRSQLEPFGMDVSSVPVLTLTVKASGRNIEVPDVFSNDEYLKLLPEKKDNWLNVVYTNGKPQACFH